MELGGLKIWLFFVPPSRVLAKGAEMLVVGELHPHIFISLFRLTTGLGIAIVLGVSMGLVIGWWRRADEALGPLVELMRPMPKAALFPILILLTGIGRSQDHFHRLLDFLHHMHQQHLRGAGVDRVWWTRCARWGQRRADFQKVVLPSALSHVVAGLRIAVASSLTMLTFAEMLAANSGIGLLVLYAQRTYRYEMMFVGIFTMCLMGGAAPICARGWSGRCWIGITPRGPWRSDKGRDQHATEQKVAAGAGSARRGECLEKFLSHPSEMHPGGVGVRDDANYPAWYWRPDPKPGAVRHEPRGLP